jgi:hypothetical protein
MGGDGMGIADERKERGKEKEQVVLYTLKKQTMRMPIPRSNQILSYIPANFSFLLDPLSNVQGC